MRVQISLKGGGMDDEKLELSVGDGTQSFKWLALAVQTRMKQEKIARRRNGPDDVLVIGISNERGDLLDPGDKIFEHTINPEGIAVTIELAPSLANDEHGDPLLTDWYAAAYVNYTQPGTAACEWPTTTTITVMHDKLHAPQRLAAASHGSIWYVVANNCQYMHNIYESYY